MTRAPSTPESFGAPAELCYVGPLDQRMARYLTLRDGVYLIWLHSQTVEHIYNRRASAAGDAEFVMRYLLTAVRDPGWVGVEARDERRFFIVYYSDVEARHLHVSLKVVTQDVRQRGAHEVWISTAFPVGIQRLTRLLRAEKLADVR